MLDTTINQILLHMNDFVILTNLEGKILAASPMVQSLINNKTDPVGQDFQIAINRLDIPIFDKKLNDFIKHLPILDIEHTCKKADGSNYNLLWSFFPLLGSDQIQEGMIAIGKDMTALKQLSFQVERLDNIIKYAPDMIYWKDKNSIHLGCNDRFATAAGYQDRQDIIGKSDFDFPWHEQAEKYNLDDKEVIETGMPKLDIEDIMPFKNGKKATVISNKVPLRDHNNNVIGILGIATDITERKKTEEALRQAQFATEELERLDNIIKYAPDWIYWKDKNSIHLGCNDQFAIAAGYPDRRDMIGKSDFDLPWGNNAQKYQFDDKQVIESGVPKLNIEDVVPLKDGKHATVISNKVPLRDPSGKIIGVLGIATDITDRKNTEQDLIKAKELAEIANQTKTEFLANMRHDIRTPLSGIVGFAEVLKGQADDPTLKEYLQNLTASAYALSDFLNEVLEAMRVSSGEIPKLKRKFHLNKVFEQIKNLYAAKANEKKLSLKLELDPKLPQFAIGDKIRLHRIALELVGNALNFTDRGEVILAVQLAKQEDQKLVIKLTVKDTGLGIPEDKQQEIYLQFKRLTPSYQGIYKGAGLGLYVVKQFINELDGEIYVDSTPGQGTCFTCVIPLQAPLLDDDSGIDDKDELQYKTYMAPLNPLPSSSPASVISSQSSTAATVLVVEDNSTAQKVARTFLTRMNCNVEIANNGEEAIHLCKQKKYDLIFMDIGLGAGMDGYEVTSFIRKQDGMQDTPIVALTAHGGEENRQRCIEVGMNAVLTKPLTQAQAADILKAFIPETRPVIPKPPKPAPARRDLPDDDEDMFQLEQFAIFDYDMALKNCGDKAMIVDLLTMLIKEQLPKEITKLKKAFAENDYPVIEHVTHTLKGSTMYVCAIRMKYACQYVERYWKTGETKLFELLYQQALRVIDQTSTYFTEWLEKNS